MVTELDDVDKGILHLLQQNARDATAAGMGDRVGVSASTVRNRIENLEDGGVVEGFHPKIDYAEAGFQLYVIVVCRAPVAERAEMAARVLEAPGVVRVRELMTGTENIHVEAVTVDSESVDDIIASIDDIGLEIVSSDIVKKTRVQPFDHFGSEAVD